MTAEQSQCNLTLERDDFSTPKDSVLSWHFEDSELNNDAQIQIARLDAEKQALKITTPVAVLTNIPLSKRKKRIRSERPNIAFKCNYCDGGASDECVGFNGVCSDVIIRNNIEIEHRTWCNSDTCDCLLYLEGEITREELDSRMQDSGYVCYESQMLREWKAMAGIVQNGERKGQPMHLSQVQTNSLDPNIEENERYIFAVFLVDSSYDGDDTDEGFVTTRSEYKLKLSPAETHQMLFWKYHANSNHPDIAAWKSGLHRYLSGCASSPNIERYCDA